MNWKSRDSAAIVNEKLFDRVAVKNSSSIVAKRLNEFKIC